MVFKSFPRSLDLFHHRGREIKVIPHRFFVFLGSFQRQNSVEFVPQSPKITLLLSPSSDAVLATQSRNSFDQGSQSISQQTQVDGMLNIGTNDKGISTTLQFVARHNSNDEMSMLDNHHIDRQKRRFIKPRKIADNCL